MCGIAGKIELAPGRPADVETAAAMTALLAHRGPDGQVVEAVGPAALGHRRLSIIDLAGGRQPMQSEDGRFHLVFNGEIYNYRGLMKGLIERGHRFASRCDAETIIHLFEERGPACLADLQGMFAFALWDARDRRLFLARDRVGKKPLYWATTGRAVVFASELKALLMEPSLARELDPRALALYLAFQYVPAPWTIFRGVAKLPPATWALVDCSGPIPPPVRVERYWKLAYEPKLASAPEAAREAVLARLEEAVAARLESEVPLGVLLSGGVDSSAVVALARRRAAGPLRTFSIGFREETHNELPFARAVARRFETEHTELIVQPDAIAALPQIVWHLDEPFGDSSALPTFFLAQITRRHVTVALNGDGGDESFAGYERYRGRPLVARYERLPRWVRAELLGPAARWGARRLPASAFLEKLDLLNELSLSDFERHYLGYLTIFPPSMLKRLWALEPAALEPSPAEWAIEEARRFEAPRGLDWMLACDVTTYLPGDLLVKMDRMTMAHGLEARSPFLDHELMELAARLPAELKAPGGELKGLLKSALRPILPAEALDRPKQGFGVPLSRWFQRDLNGLLRETLLGERARRRGFFRPEAVRRLVEQHLSGRFLHAHRLWALLMFELWARTFLDPPSPPRGPVAGLP